jgi:anti-sigma regulatory factor (Ser/Thr protein kinase)
VPLELVLTAQPDSAASARAALRGLLEPGRPDVDAALLLVSELVANAVRYGGEGEIVVRARVTAGRLRVDVPVVRAGGRAGSAVGLTSAGGASVLVR